MQKTCDSTSTWLESRRELPSVRRCPDFRCFRAGPTLIKAPANEGSNAAKKLFPITGDNAHLGDLNSAAQLVGASSAPNFPEQEPARGTLI
jgi:hypothetical protein